MKYFKWVLIGTLSGVALALLLWLLPDMRVKVVSMAAIGGGVAGLGRWLLSLLRVSVDLQDKPEGVLIKSIDLPGQVGKYLVVGVVLAGARLFLGHVAFV